MHCAIITYLRYHIVMQDFSLQETIPKASITLQLTTTGSQSRNSPVGLVDIRYIMAAKRIST